MNKNILSPNEIKGFIQYLGKPKNVYYKLKKSLKREPDLTDLGKALGFKVDTSLTKKVKK